MKVFDINADPTKTLDDQEIKLELKSLGELKEETVKVKWSFLCVPDLMPPRGAILLVDRELVKVIKRDFKRNKVWVIPVED